MLMDVWLVLVHFLKVSDNVGCLSFAKGGSSRIHAKRVLNYLVLSMKRHVFFIFIQSNSEANSILVDVSNLITISPVWDEMSIYQGSVMFWIHGGSYVTGGTKDMFNGTQLAKEFGVSRLESLGAHVFWWKASVRVTVVQCAVYFKVQRCL